MNARISLPLPAPKAGSRRNQTPDCRTLPTTPFQNRRRAGLQILPAAFALLAVLLLPCSRGLAAALLNENFDGYNLGALDANGGGPNSGPNGGPGNPWWGPFAPNLQVVDQEFGVFPHSGTNMARGRNAGAADMDFINLAYRFHGGQAFTGNVLCDWWFFDPLGAGPSANLFSDYLALGNYPALTTTADYGGNLNNIFQLAQPVMALGGTDHEGGAFDATVYQAQVFGATNGYDPGDALNNWFNTTTPRSAGWHHARILVSKVTTNGLIDVNFFIDDVGNATLTKTTSAGNGFNAIQILADNGSTGDQSAYYDDILFYTDPPLFANPQIGKIGTNLVVTFPDRWILQTSTTPVGSSFVDVTNAVSPYTNSAGTGTQFFRLRY